MGFSSLIAKDASRTHRSLRGGNTPASFVYKRSVSLAVCLVAALWVSSSNSVVASSSAGQQHPLELNPTSHGTDSIVFDTQLSRNDTNPTCIDDFWPCSATWSGNVVLMILYGIVLAYGAKLIADGSEYLLQILDPGVIGGLVLPVLGAVPDAAIIVVSGAVGTVASAQHQLDVGIGTLAGSTVMLLTIPYGIGMIIARCDIRNGRAVDRTLKNGWHLMNTGVTVHSDVPKSVKYMMGTALSYLVIQGVAFEYLHDGSDTDPAVVHRHAEHEKYFALTTMILCIGAFIGYSWWQVRSSRLQTRKIREAREAARRQELLRKWGRVILTTFVPGARNSLLLGRPILGEGASTTAASASGTVGGGKTAGGGGESTALLAYGGDPEHGVSERLLPLQDAADYGGTNSTSVALGGSAAAASSTSVVVVNAGGGVEGGDAGASANVARFAQRWKVHARRASTMALAEEALAAQRAEIGDGSNASDNDDEDDDDDDDGDEGGAAGGSEPQKPWKIAVKAFSIMFVGVAMVCIFSDPMVDVIEQFGQIINIRAFYVSFIVTPICSNASELISSLIFASRKRCKTSTITFGQLYGAACMNNTMCLGIFVALVFFRGLEWTYSAEVLGILAVVIGVGVMSLRPTMRLWKAWAALALYPLCILLIYILETYLHWH